MMRSIAFPRLYAIMDADLLRTYRGGELAFAQMLVQSGVQIIQYRDKRASTSHLYEVSRNLISAVPSGCRIVVNDRADVAALAGAGGVHVGQEDLPVEAARRICGPSCWVGISTHNAEQVRVAAQTSADYIAVGPIFATATKENPDPVVGLDFIREARRLTSKPLVAIGGITLEHASDVFRAGADSVAVIRDLLSTENPGERARAFLAAGESAQKSGGH